MTIMDMLGQSLTLTLLGLGVVFGFLIILIIFMQLTQKLVKALKLDKEPETQTSSSVVQPTALQNNAIIAAIATAVKEKQK